MNKSDLKDGMVIEKGSGKRQVFVAKAQKFISLTGHNNLGDFLEDLTPTEHFDRINSINKVYEVNYSNVYCLEDIFQDRNLILKWERKEPVKLTILQHEMLKRYIELKTQYIARDRSESIWAYPTKPYKSETQWIKPSDFGHLRRVDTDLSNFDFVKWEDSEPTNIQELLDNCEVID